MSKTDKGLKCHRCKQHYVRDGMIGANLFDALTGSHIITRWHCKFCAEVVGLITND